MQPAGRHLLLTICLAASLAGCARAPVALQPKLGSPHRPAGPATFRIADAALPTPLVFVAYGDMRFELKAKTVVGEMIRLSDSAAPAPGKWEVRDRFELTLPP
jgi:hypothetical protein